RQGRGALRDERVEAVIEVRDLRKVYPDGTEAVKGITFQVERGEFFGFLGPNGAGKSTTIKMLITLLAPTGGEARVLGHDVSREPDAIRRGIGYAAQEVGVDDDLTGRENLLLQGRLYHLPAEELRRGRLIAEGSPAALKAQLGGDVIALTFRSDGQPP